MIARSVSLLDGTHLIEGPVDEDGLAVDVLAVDHAPGAAVVRGTAMIAHDEILVDGHDGSLHAIVVAILVGDVGLVELAAIDVDFAAVHFDGVAGDSDHTLDIRLAGIERIPEDDGIAAVDAPGAERVRDLVDENAFAFRESR